LDLEALEVDALRLSELGRRFDLVVGTFVLHHLEPFRGFVAELHNVVRPGGRGIFYENNGRNALLRFARNHVAGRLGIPKFGDEEEEPLTLTEVELLRERFRSVLVEYPGLVFFELAKPYLFRNSPRVSPVLAALDGAVYRFLPAARQYGYHQIITVSRA
jgi:SAM-dependent methyltransferase